MANRDYNRYIKSKKWRIKRQSFLDYLMEQNGVLKCQKCRKPYGPYFNVHHTSYDNFKNEDFGDLLLLCEDCHNRIHGHKPRRKKSIPPLLLIKGIDY